LTLFDTVMSRQSFVTIVCFMWALPTLFFASCEVTARAGLDVSGTVVGSLTACQQPQNNRCVTTYTLQPASGAGNTFVYQAGPNDASLQRDLLVRTEISKQKWALAYRINGRLIDDFPITFYGIVAAVGMALLLTGIVRLAMRLMRSNTAGPGGPRG